MLLKFLLTVYLVILWTGIVMSVTPTAILKMKKTYKTLYAAPGNRSTIALSNLQFLIYFVVATFGTDLSSEQTAAPRKLIVPTNDANGCDPELPILPRNSAYFLLVSRGNCSFAEKAEVRMLCLIILSF